MESAKHDQKSKIFNSIFLIIIFITVALVFLKFYVERDYKVLVHTECNPSEEICFEIECDNATDTRCTGNGVKHFGVMFKKAHSLPPFSCKNGNTSNNCQIFLCNEKNISDLEIDAICTELI